MDKAQAPVEDAPGTLIFNVSNVSAGVWTFNNITNAMVEKINQKAHTIGYVDSQIRAYSLYMLQSCILYLQGYLLMLMIISLSFNGASIIHVRGEGHISCPTTIKILVPIRHRPNNSRYLLDSDQNVPPKTLRLRTLIMDYGC